MVIDTSAILAILFEEAEFDEFVALIDGAVAIRLSAATYVEAATVLQGRGDAAQRAALDSLIEESNAIVEPVTFEQARLAAQAFRLYGKGLHPARLNFGDCFSYALAKAAKEPLLYKGNDFSKTDIVGAAMPSQ